MARRRLLPILATAAISGCGGGDDDAERSLAGDLTVDAVGTAYPFAQAAADQFQTEHPVVAIAVTRSASKDAFQRFCAGRVDLALSPHPIPGRHARGCGQAGMAYSEFEAASEGVGQPLYVYAERNPRTPAARALRDFIRANDELIGDAATGTG